MSRQMAMPGSGYRHNRQPRPQQQMDLFGSGLSNGAMDAPAWPELPAEARATLMNLMTQLILDHAAMTATPRAKEVSRDL
jgi:cytochrome b561